MQYLDPRDPYNQQDNCRDYNTLIYVWDSAPFCWSDARINNTVFCWSDVSFILGVGEDQMYAEQNYENLKEAEKDIFITITCRVKGYDEAEETKKKVKAELTVRDITTTVREVRKSMNVTIKND